jgi:hypothetical protein
VEGAGHCALVGISVCSSRATFALSSPAEPRCVKSRDVCCKELGTFRDIPSGRVPPRRLSSRVECSGSNNAFDSMVLILETYSIPAAHRHIRHHDVDTTVGVTRMHDCVPIGTIPNHVHRYT